MSVLASCVYDECHKNQCRSFREVGLERNEAFKVLCTVPVVIELYCAKGGWEESPVRTPASLQYCEQLILE